jgi:DNA-3-methyladenine glycosylase
MNSKLPLNWYTGTDVVKQSRDLVGKFLFTEIIAGQLTGGMIVETEAYAGEIDKGSHAYKGKRTSRTEVMFRDGGIAYVYLIYGFHDMFNVVVGPEGTPHAILIRAIEPTEGINVMLERREMHRVEPRLTAGPGVLCKALGITRHLNGESLLGSKIWIEDRQIEINDEQIIASPRVNIDYAGIDAILPWRFRKLDNPWTSKAK